MHLFGYLCFVFVILSCRLFIAVLWSPAWRDHLLALLYWMFYCVFITFQGGVLGQVLYFIYRFLIFASFVTLRNESKIISSFKWCPKDCCLAHRRRKLFNIGGGWGQSQRGQFQYLWRGIAKMYIYACMHTRMNEHRKAHVHALKCSYTHACMHIHMFACMHMQIHQNISIFTFLQSNQSKRFL